MKRNDTIWKTEAASKSFLEGLREAMPLANEQINVMLRIIQTARPNVENFLDLGCGDGILGQAILTQHPGAKGVFLDFSESMLQAAQRKLGDSGNKVEFIIQDFGNKEWVDGLQEKKPFDVIVSGLAIHHQPDWRKQEIYQEIYELLKPGGIFLNIEHIASKSELCEKIHNELIIDSLYRLNQGKGSSQSKDEIAQEYHNRPGKKANILAPVELQCDWLTDAGFIQVDCFMKIFELTVFGGIRPEKEQ